MAGRFNFPQWNYGYTLGPPGYTGDYTQYYNYYSQPGVAAPPPPPGAKIVAAPPAQAPAPPVAVQAPAHIAVKVEPPTPAVIKAAPVMNTPVIKPPVAAVVKSEPAVSTTVTAGPMIGPVNPESSQTEAGQAGGETSSQLQSILRGRNPVIFCNYQSKMRNLQMEWEQVSETGPPHDKTFTYQLKLGNDLTSTGEGKNKKDAKTKAAEVMVLKLDQLPRVAKRPMSHMNNPWGMGRNNYRGHWANKRKKPDSEEQILKQNDITPKAVNPSMNNPISLLFEHCKRRRWPEPLFDTIKENVLETRKTQQGFTLKKTEFTIRCTVRQQVEQGEDQTYLGSALTKKQAKAYAAAAAWAAVGSGNTQVGVDKQVTTAAAAAAAPAPATPASVPAPQPSAAPTYVAAPASVTVPVAVPASAAPIYSPIGATPKVITTTPKREGYIRYHRY